MGGGPKCQTIYELREPELREGNLRYNPDLRAREAHRTLDLTESIADREVAGVAWSQAGVNDVVGGL
jgi:hypothetical protein